MSIKDLRPPVKVKENQIKFGTYFREDLNHGIWNRQQVYQNLNRFVSGDFGDASQVIVETNNENIKREKGGILGVYNNPEKESKVFRMLAYYDPSYDEDSIYVLNYEDFQNVPKSWDIGEDEYVKTYGTRETKAEEVGKDYKEKREKTSRKILYNEKGHTLTGQQRNYNRELYPSSIGNDLSDQINELKNRLNKLKSEEGKLRVSYENGTAEQLKSFWEANKERKEIEKKIDQLVSESEKRGRNAEIAHEPVSVPAGEFALEPDIEAVKKGLKTGIGANGKKIKNFDPEWDDELRSIAQETGRTYDEVIERFAELTSSMSKNFTYDDAMEFMRKNYKKPYYFTDSDKPYGAIFFDITNLPINKKSNTYTFSMFCDEKNIGFDEFSNAIESVLGKDWRKKFKVDNLRVGYPSNDVYKIEETTPKRIQFLYKVKVNPEKVDDSKVKRDSKPEWLDDETIDDIVYDKAWPVSVKEVAHELVKKGVRSQDSAIKYVREYVRNNPSERKHFKDEDFEDFTKHTSQGYEIISIYENEFGRKFIIAYRNNRNDYFVGAGYDVIDGTLEQGYYDYDSEKEAVNFLYNKYGCQILEQVYHK